MLPELDNGPFQGLTDKERVRKISDLVAPVVQAIWDTPEERDASLFS